MSASVNGVTGPLLLWRHGNGCVALKPGHVRLARLGDELLIALLNRKLEADTFAAPQVVKPKAVPAPHRLEPMRINRAGDLLSVNPSGYPHRQFLGLFIVHHYPGLVGKMAVHVDLRGPAVEQQIDGSSRAVHLDDSVPRIK